MVTVEQRRVATTRCCCGRRPTVSVGSSTCATVERNRQGCPTHRSTPWRASLVSCGVPDVDATLAEVLRVLRPEDPDAPPPDE
jgi:hypothetical protein